MNQHSYQRSIVANTTPAEAFDSVNRVNKWWAKNFEGSSKNPGDLFTVRFGETFMTFKVGEFIPKRKIEWKVIDCYLYWIDNKTEWTGTRIVFEFEKKDDKTLVTMTHIGLVPEAECYEDCSVGWDKYFKVSLYGLLSHGIGQPV